MLAMFACSAAYNLHSSPRWTDTLQRFDHAAIFLKIAGTYTPFGVLIGGFAGHVLLSVVWSIALLGAGTKFIRAHWKGIDIPIYLLLGWVGVLAFYPLMKALPTPALVLLALGGVLYSVGVIFHLWRGLKYHNAIWHAFVLVATGCHFGAVTTAAFA
jgi:hemolysin III